MAKYIKNAFTLAEVLIVLGIIGIIAEITLPSLVKDYQKTVYKAEFLESYSILKQASTQILSDNDGDIAGVYPAYTDLANALTTKLKVAKTCAVGTSISGGCWTPKTKSLSLSDPGTYWYHPQTSPTIVLANGMAIQYYDDYYYSDCTDASFVDPKSTGFCSMIWVDVNGLKNPNTYGRDIFLFYFVNQLGIIPDGVPGTDNYDTGWSFCNLSGADPSSNGWACGGRIMLKGSMDY